MAHTLCGGEIPLHSVAFREREINIILELVPKFILSVNSCLHIPVQLSGKNSSGKIPHEQRVRADSLDKSFHRHKSSYSDFE